MNGATLGQAMGNSLTVGRYSALVPHCETAMRQANITNVNRAAMWLAQLGHESVGLKYTEEIASGSAYEGRPDLGNNRPGDGVRFKGRSFIQITGRHNYTQLSAWAFGKGYVPTRTYFVDNPPQLAADRFAFLGAVWYWLVARPNLNALADARDLNGATRAINGALNGLPDRQQRYARCLSLGAAILPTTPTKDWFDMATKADLRAVLDEYLGAKALGGQAFPMRTRRMVNRLYALLPAGDAEKAPGKGGPNRNELFDALGKRLGIPEIKAQLKRIEDKLK